MNDNNYTDLTLEDKDKKMILLIDMACPNEANKEGKRDEKISSRPCSGRSVLVCEFSCQCEARYVGRTTQRLADRIKQHVPTRR